MELEVVVVVEVDNSIFNLQTDKIYQKQISNSNNFSFVNNKI